MSYIEKAISYVGGPTAMMKKLREMGIEVPRQNLWMWQRRKQAPAKYIQVVAEACDNVVSPLELLKDHENEAA